MEREGRCDGVLGYSRSHCHLMNSGLLVTGFYCWGWEFLTALLLFSCAYRC
uniref:Uncharacterized protein n=1 Tax=Nelumbo nucifera TaxID=4432 RepID=A0A822ZC73_NELNU|nr:TPA_asm: hypothetical protein HUJ06_015614 [Nelumbo nucifera]